MLALLVVCCAVIYGMVMVFLPQNYYSDLEGQVKSDFDELVWVVAQNGWESSTEEIRRFAIKHYALVNIVDGHGKNVFSLNCTDAGPQAPVTVERHSSGFGATFHNGRDVYYMIATAALVTAARPLIILLRLMPLFVAVIVLISVAGALICSRYYSKPLLAISRVARQMAALDLTGQCEVNRRDEIGTLAASLNEMSAQLNEALTGLQAANEQLKQDIEREREQERQRVEFFTAVSHELKTPIAIIKGQLEGMIYEVGEYRDRDTCLRRCLKTTNDMEALVKDILAAARMGGSEFHLAPADLDLSELLQAGCRRFLGPMEDRQLTLCADIPPGVHVRGDRRLLEKVVSNVIGNAVAYSPSGARILVTLRDGRFTVENTGVHLDGEDLTRVFTPFYRVDKSRSRNSGGSGLGLYIVKTILDHHGMRCAMDNTENGVQFTAEWGEPACSGSGLNPSPYL